MGKVQCTQSQRIDVIHGTLLKGPDRNIHESKTKVRIISVRAITQLLWHYSGSCLQSHGALR